MDPTTATGTAVLDLAAARPATLGNGRLVCVDGPAGAGKSSLAAALVAASGAPLVPMDDLYEGWTGLGSVDGLLEGLLRPLAAGRPGHYRRWDWTAGARAERVEVPAGVPLLVVEGVGSGSARIADLITVLVLVDAPVAVRRRRALARDGNTFAPHWDAWARAERRRFAIDDTRRRADLRVDGRGQLRP